MLSECFQNTTNRPMMDRTLSACFPHAFRRILKTFGKHSSYSRSVRKAYGTQHLQIFIPNAPRTRRMLPEHFLYMPYASRMLPEYFPNTHRRHIRMVDNNYFELAQHIFGSTECRFVCIRMEPKASMLPEHTGCFPNMIRSLPEHPNSYSEKKWNGIRASVIGPLCSIHSNKPFTELHFLQTPSYLKGCFCSYIFTSVHN